MEKKIRQTLTKQTKQSIWKASRKFQEVNPNLTASDVCKMVAEIFDVNI